MHVMQHNMLSDRFMCHIDRKTTYITCMDMLFNVTRLQFEVIYDYCNQLLSRFDRHSAVCMIQVDVCV